MRVKVPGKQWHNVGRLGHSGEVRLTRKSFQKGNFFCSAALYSLVHCRLRVRLQAAGEADQCMRANIVQFRYAAKLRRWGLPDSQEGLCSSMHGTQKRAHRAQQCGEEAAPPWGRCEKKEEQHALLEPLSISVCGITGMVVALWLFFRGLVL